MKPEGQNLTFFSLILVVKLSAKIMMDMYAHVFKSALFYLTIQ